ncbi:MAG: TolC family protein [Treponema sp.]|nr:TolC family protein [Treponema sp.]
MRKKLCAAAIILLLSVSAHAQETQPLTANSNVRQLTPDQAVDLALKNNLSLESSRTSLSTKKRASDFSWNQFIPSITIGGGLSRSNEASKQSGFIPLEQIPLNPLYTNPLTGTSLLPPGVPEFYGVVPYSIELPQWNVVGNIQMSLSISAAMFENMRRLRIDYEGGLLSYEKAKLQLERDVRKAYHSILLLQENITLLRGSYQNVESQVQMAQANYDAGLAPELTVLQARVARENMRPAIDQVENGLKLSMAQFAMFLGMEYNAEFELVPVTEAAEFISLDVTEMISKAASGKPDIQELRHTIMMMQSARRSLVFSLTPALSLGWTSQSLFNPLKDPWKDPWFENKDDWIRSGSFTIMLGVRLHSLIPWSQDFQGIKNMDDQIRTATIGLAQLINGTEIEVYNIVLSLERIHLNTRTLSETVTLAEQSYRMTEAAYRAGLQDYFQVQSAEQSLRQARVQLLEQQFNYLNGLIDLEYSIGVPFGTLSKRSK